MKKQKQKKINDLSQLKSIVDESKLSKYYPQDDFQVFHSEDEFIPKINRKELRKLPNNN